LTAPGVVITRRGGFFILGEPIDPASDARAARGGDEGGRLRGAATGIVRDRTKLIGNLSSIPRRSRSPHERHHGSKR